jgi:hypothetical protein
MSILQLARHRGLRPAHSENAKTNEGELTNTPLRPPEIEIARQSNCVYTLTTTRRLVQADAAVIRADLESLGRQPGFIRDGLRNH